MTALRWGAATDVGRVRSNNEDSMLIAPDLFAVADGMGGHKGGEVASRMALEVLRQAFDEASVVTLVEAAEQANREVFGAAGHEPDLRGMGTTLVAIAPVGSTGELGWINVGDSRLYLLRDGELSKLSIDHSLVEDMVRDGRISEAEARVHPKRNIVTRALGISPHVDVDPGTVIPHLHDRYMLCSDGLYDVVDDDRIAAVMRRLGDPGEVAHELVRQANEGGGRDNITVVVVDVVDDSNGAAVASTTIVGGGEGHAEFSHLFAQATGGEAPPAPVPGPQRTPEHDLTSMAATPASGWTDPTAGDDTEAVAPFAPTAAGPEPTGRLATVPAPPNWIDTAPTDRDGAAPPAGKHSAPTAYARPRRLTLGVVAFFVLLLAILGAGGYAIDHEARNSYFVGLDNGTVAIFQGRPGGLLWIDPKVVERFNDIPAAQVPQPQQAAVQAGKTFGSRDAAKEFIQKLREEISGTDVEPTTTTTTPTPTTAVTPTTVVGPTLPGPAVAPAP
jgi:PPM family protein phosphatase